jgi:putative NADPH-quinone reductase
LTPRKKVSRPLRDDARMSHRIAVIQGHPDAAGAHYGHTLADAYAQGALAAGHALRRIEVAQIDFPWLRSKAEWEQGALPVSLQEAQAAIQWANHLVFVFPLWLGGMPALLKGFLEQVARPDFAITRVAEGSMPKKLLAGRSARVVVTMGMPAFVYRWYFGAHSLKALELNILGFCGIAPIHRTLIGSVESVGSARRDAWCARMHLLGRGAR